LYMLHFHPGFDREAIAREMRLFDEQFTKPLAKDIKPHLNDRNPDRKLKVGYVSPNFYYQAEGYFLLPLLRAHDHANFEIHCYSCVTKPDRTTELFKKSSDVWHEVASESDETLAKRIHEDRIDILVDLTMHMRDNRLLLFARKPAPVQVTWLAHPGGTGVSAIDYRFTDAHLDPEGTDQFYAEKSFRLPDCWCCYDAFSKNTIERRPRDFIRFGSLNSPVKHNESVLRLWGRVLGEVPKSRLLLLNLSDDHRRRILEIFAAAGVNNERLEFARYLQRDKYLQSYNEIDVCLDPFPYNGITTTLDALWMGVPVVTLVGQTAPSRASLSILATAGLDEFVARTPDEFVAAAVRAVDHPRAEIREKLIRSPLFDYKRFALNVENAYREMWRGYVETA
jgi:protein O-GlcNAc transferase